MQTASATGRMEARSTKSGGSDDSVTVNTASVTKRLQQELTSLMCSQDGDVSAFPSAESLFSWVGTIGVSLWRCMLHFLQLECLRKSTCN